MHLRLKIAAILLVGAAVFGCRFDDGLSKPDQENSENIAVSEARSEWSPIPWLNGVSFDNWITWETLNGPNRGLTWYLATNGAGEIEMIPQTASGISDNYFYRYLVLDYDKIAIWSYARAMWVCCDYDRAVAGVAPFIANRTGVGSWEIFRFYGNREEYLSNNGNVTFLSNNLLKVKPGYDPGRAELGGAVYHIFQENRGPISAKVAIKWQYSGKYISSDLNYGNAGPLYSNRDAVGRWETFYLIDRGTDSAGNHMVALRSWATNKYLGADATGTRLQADRDVLDGSTQFNLVSLESAGYGVNSAALQSRVNGLFFRGDSFQPTQAGYGYGIALKIEGLSGF